jgi:hypothetical protein
MHETDANAYTIPVERLERKRALARPTCKDYKKETKLSPRANYTDGRIIIQIIFKKYGFRIWTGFI